MTVVASTQQLTLDFEPGLTEKYPHLMDCIRACAYTYGRPLKSLAMDMDMTLSDLSRKLNDNPSDPRHFHVEDLERFMEITCDFTPIHWLAAKFLEDEKSRQSRAVHELNKQLPDLLALLKAATGGAA